MTRTLLEKTAAGWALLGGVILIAIVLVTVTNVGAFTLDRAARDRTRSAGRTGAVLGHTERGGVPVHDSSGRGVP